jgi:hypothetical protein
LKDRDVSEPSAYDVVDYPSWALPQAHPGHLYAVARMFGLGATPPDRCRYLEVACGDATHLIACALGLPDARFVGIDSSPAAIGRGKQLAEELGLGNVSLSVADLTTWRTPEGAFDYAVAHGVYSWVPRPVRDGLLALLARALPRNGVGYVSYNTYPGGYVRRMMREIMQFHTAGSDAPAEKMRKAVEVARFLSAGRPADQPGDAALALLEPELKALTNGYDPRLLYHDDLGAVNDPVYFHEFAAHAAQFGLRFVAESRQHLMEIRGFPPAVAEPLKHMAARDVVQKEQYLDFLRLRRFRETLLSPDPAAPRGDPDPARIGGLAVSGDPKPEADPVELAPGAAVTFRTGKGASLRTESDVVKAALLELGERWPARLPFGDLLWAAANKLGRKPTPDDTNTLASVLTTVWMGGMVELHGHRPSYAATASERPVSSPLARRQLRAGTETITLFHTNIQFEDVVSRGVVLLLDGTRDLDRLTADLLDAFPPGQRPALDGFRATVERNVTRLARLGLLVE